MNTFRTQGGNYFAAFSEIGKRKIEAWVRQHKMAARAVRYETQGCFGMYQGFWGFLIHILSWILIAVGHTGTLSEAPSEGILTRGALKKGLLNSLRIVSGGSSWAESLLQRHEDERSRSHEGICTTAEMLHPPGWPCSSDAVSAQKCSQAASEPSSMTLFRMGWDPVLFLWPRHEHGGDIRVTV